MNIVSFWKANYVICSFYFTIVCCFDSVLIVLWEDLLKTHWKQLGCYKQWLSDEGMYDSRNLAAHYVWQTHGTPTSK